MGIERIEIGGFCGAQQISRLLLHENKLTSLPSLCPLKCRLMLLSLNNNNIGLVNNDSFKGFKKLSKINLSSNNLIQSPHLHWIRHSLVTFDASVNDIQSLDMIQPFGIFEVLNLFSVTGNKIRHFNVSILRHMPKLMRFYITSNELSHIDDFRRIYDEAICSASSSTASPIRTQRHTQILSVQHLFCDLRWFTGTKEKIQL